jgi:alpha-beta hydrolase superfamily lysophospholipase
MVPIAARIARHGRDRVAVVLLRNRVRGWNAPVLDPVRDAEWALGRITNRFGHLPVGLVGHSMGGRTAMRVAGSEGVISVVGLAPWLPLGEPVEQLAGRSVLIVHGSADRTTDPRASAVFAERARPIAEQVGYVLVPGVRHGLLRHRRLIEDVAAGYAVSTVLGDDRTGTAGRTGSAAATNLLQRVLAGADRIEL